MMIKKESKYLIIGFTFLAILMFSFNSKFVSASDDDDDGINDDFEELNKRDIEIDISDNEIQVESHLRSGDKIDNIQLKVQYESEGLSIQVSYEKEYNSGSETELQFGVKFPEIIEYIDNDDNGVYNSDIDSTIQILILDEFYPVNYSLSKISGDSDFIPAAKLARREGLDVILDPMWNYIQTFPRDLKSTSVPNFRATEQG
ncbi:hypothetical protein LCGC14_1960370 [marine sediment metagenome]|uniref:Uncharacterized protein n=1 Tax=marine sediment metagenome TaxID=412755 RepID=A0A0F9IBW5_9ZZZZ